MSWWDDGPWLKSSTPSATTVTSLKPHPTVPTVRHRTAARLPARTPGPSAPSGPFSTRPSRLASWKLKSVWLFLCLVVLTALQLKTQILYTIWRAHPNLGPPLQHCSHLSQVLALHSSLTHLFSVHCVHSWYSHRLLHLPVTLSIPSTWWSPLYLSLTSQLDITTSGMSPSSHRLPYRVPA